MNIGDCYVHAKFKRNSFIFDAQMTQINQNIVEVKLSNSICACSKCLRAKLWVPLNSPCNSASDKHSFDSKI